MDKKQLYIVMVVSVLMLVGIFVWRWVAGGTETTEKKEKKPAAERSAMATATQPEKPSGMKAGGAKEAAKEPTKTASPKKRIPTVSASPTTVDLSYQGQTDQGLLQKKIWVAIERRAYGIARKILEHAATEAETNQQLLSLLWLAREAVAVDPAARQELAAAAGAAVTRLKTTAVTGPFERAYGEAIRGAVADLALAPMQAVIQRAFALAKSDHQRATVLTLWCGQLLRHKQLGQARFRCKLAREKGGDPPLHRLSATLALAENPRALEAEAWLVKALKLQPTDFLAARALVALQRRLGKPQEAAVTAVASGKALAQAGRHQQAIQQFGQALEIKPQNGRALAARAQSLVAVGKREEGIKGLRKAAELAKGDVTVRLQLAAVLVEKEILAAVKVLEEAEQIDPTNPRVKQQLAAARQKLLGSRPKKLPEQVTKIEGKLLKMHFSSWGGVPRMILLKHRKYRERGKVAGPKLKVDKLEKRYARQVNLVRTWSEYWWPFRIWLDKSTFAHPDWWHQDWERLRWDAKRKTFTKLKAKQTHAVKHEGKWTFGYRWPVTYPGMAPPEVVIDRIYTIDPDADYHWTMEIRFVNRSSRKQTVRMQMDVPTLDKVKEERSMFNPISLQKEAVCMVGDKVVMQTLPNYFGGSSGCMGCDASSCACRRTPADKGSGMCSGKVGSEVHHEKSKKWQTFTGKVHWAGIDEMYFLLAVALDEKQDTTCELGGYKEGVLYAKVAFTDVDILHKGSVVTRRFTIYSGPKISERLEQVRVGSKNPKLSEAIDYGLFWFLGQPMIWTMKQIQKVVGNWGLAIILLTILIKLLTMPFTLKQMRSMKGMAKLKPEMDKLKEKYGDDKQRFQQEMWALYKAHKINPLGGCLPMLLQMPIYIAWYQALMVSVDLYQAPLFGWITDLTKPDSVELFGFGLPILPLVMGATMFLQQRMTPTTADNAQAKMMMYMMPAMFTFFMLFLPSGLTLYILTNTVLSMIHQWYMNHTD